VAGQFGGDQEAQYDGHVDEQDVRIEERIRPGQSGLGMQQQGLQLMREQAGGCQPV
jgi:hypothetical protein